MFNISQLSDIHRNCLLVRFKWDESDFWLFLFKYVTLFQKSALIAGIFAFLFIY